MKEEALKMILGMMAIAVLITVISGHLLALIIMGLAAWSVWWLATQVDG